MPNWRFAPLFVDEHHRIIGFKIFIAISFNLITVNLVIFIKNLWQDVCLNLSTIDVSLYELIILERSWPSISLSLSIDVITRVIAST
jgi:hypothetical protein